MRQLFSFGEIALQNGELGEIAEVDALAPAVAGLAEDGDASVEIGPCAFQVAAGTGKTGKHREVIGFALLVADFATNRDAVFEVAQGVFGSPDGTGGQTELRKDSRFTAPGGD